MSNNNEYNGEAYLNYHMYVRPLIYVQKSTQHQSSKRNSTSIFMRLCRESSNVNAQGHCQTQRMRARICGTRRSPSSLVYIPVVYTSVYALAHGFTPKN